jgi:hypothetical protein
MKYPKRSQYQYAKSPYRIRNWPEYEAGLRPGLSSEPCNNAKTSDLESDSIKQAPEPQRKGKERARGLAGAH